MLNKGCSWFETLAIVCEKTRTSLYLGTSLHFHKSNVSYMHVFYFCFRFNIFMVSRILGILLYIKTVKFFPQHISAHKQPKLGRSRLYSFPAFLIAAMGKNVEVAIFRNLVDWKITSVNIFNDWNGTWTHNDLLCKQTLNHLANHWPVWLNSWAFVYKLSGCGFWSHCSHLNFKYCTCFEQGVPWQATLECGFTLDHTINIFNMFVFLGRCCNEKKYICSKIYVPFY